MFQIRNYSLPYDMPTQHSRHHEPTSRDNFYERYDRQRNYRPSANTHYHICNEEHYPSRRTETRFDPYSRFDRLPDYHQPPSRHRELPRGWDSQPARQPYDYHTDTWFPDYADENEDPNLSRNDDRTNRLDDYHTDFFPHLPLDKAVMALKDLSDAGIEKNSKFDRGISANDVRAGKHGQLTPAITKELEKLDKNKDYRLVSDRTQFTQTNLWFPTAGGKPVVITHLQPGSPHSHGTSALLDFLELSNTLHDPIGYGLSANKLRSGRVERLPLAVRESLQKLDPNKEYDLVCFPDKHKDSGGMMTWVERGTGAKFEVGFDDETPIY